MDFEDVQREETFDEAPQYGARVYVVLAAILLAVSAVVLLQHQWQESVPVRQVSIEGITILSRDEILALMELPPSAKTYEVELTALEQRIRANTFVKEVVVKRDAPTMLRVSITERTPEALLVLKNSDRTVYVDDEGVVLPYVSTQEVYDIPVISGIDSAMTVKPGTHLQREDVREALKIIRVAKLVGEDLYHAISEIRVNHGHDIILYSFENGIPIIIGRGSIEKKLVKLDAFWKKFVKNNNGEAIRYIDLRFEDQVILSPITTS